MSVMAKETRYAEQPLNAACGRLVGKCSIFAVCVPKHQGLGGNGKRHGRARD
jgi:hypothetical protein